MQGLVHGRHSVRAHPKARSELDAMEHQNFLFGMERIRVTQEWVDEGELPRERTKNRRWRRTYEVLAEATHGEVVVRRRVFVYASELVLDESLSHQHMRAVYHRGRSPKLLGGHSGVEAGGRKGRGSDASPVGLSYPKAKRRLERRWTRRSTTVPQKRIYRSRRKGCRCKITNSRAMSLATPWYCGGGASLESSIPCSHRGRALVEKRSRRWRMQRQTPSTKTRRKGRGQGTS
ncbi:hypothetical protein B296_00041817 [Ensete ventricosum]|uniref:Uncharacterized protein n=1 Tax=Ensete ventricosum TaxID=4639 RepID=A0A426YIB3_ENSVE|nr:hypothetical protein B296_00041817 [Ensete ventricosum]